MQGGNCGNVSDRKQYVEHATDTLSEELWIGMSQYILTPVPGMVKPGAALQELAAGTARRDGTPGHGGAA